LSGGKASVQSSLFVISHPTLWPTITTRVRPMCQIAAAGEVFPQVPEYAEYRNPGISRIAPRKSCNLSQAAAN
jgi:hypothetical protein